MKKIFLLIALTTSINVSAQKEYTTKGFKRIVQFDGVERIADIERIHTMNWEVTDSILVRMSWALGRAEFDITKKTKLKNGTIIYDLTNPFPSRVEISASHIISYDSWPNWDNKLVLPLIKK
jgi:hypothetical protein